MLETRLPVSSLSSTLTRPVARHAPAREPGGPARAAAPAPARPARTVTPPAVPRRAARRALSQSRLARSEARMLTLAVAVTTLMCAVLVIYLAAYAHVTQLGLEQAAAHQQLIRAQRDNHRLQMVQADLQNPAAIAARAAHLGMTPYTGVTTYVSAANGGAQTDLGADAQGADSGITADEFATGRH